MRVTQNRGVEANAVDMQDLARVVRRRGLLVAVRCYASPTSAGERFEVVMWGNGNRGIVDVPPWERDRLEERITNAVEVFAHAVALRHTTPTQTVELP